MKLPLRLLRRMLVVVIGVLGIWLVLEVFEFADNRSDWMLALAAAYAAAAYVIFPFVVRMNLKILQRKRVPSYTITGDGLPGDPVNLALAGTMRELCAAFRDAGWSEADPLGLGSSWRMVKAFVFNRPYQTAPFSTLYLYGRGQDIGFQKAIDDSPRKRHHIRFWALGLESAKTAATTPGFWWSTERPPDGERVLWVGAGTKDTGLGLTRLTFQITHATDDDTNAERDFIVDELKKARVIGDTTRYQAGEHLSGKVNHYVTDGEVTIASLAGDLRMEALLQR